MSVPPALDIEYNPYGSSWCYGLTPWRMVLWISAFSNEVRARTGCQPVIYTTTQWWKACTNNSAFFATNHPLWIARYSSTVGELPAGWPYHTFWQYASSGALPGDQNMFNGSMERLRALARG